MSLDLLNTVVVKRFATEEAGNELALVVGSCDAPTFRLINADGDQYTWRQDLTRAAIAEESVQYWRTRAETYERLFGKMSELQARTMDQNSKLIEKSIDKLLEADLTE